MLYLYALSPGYFQVSFVVLVLKEGTSLGTLEIVTLAVGIPYTLFWCILGWCMVGTYIYSRIGIFLCSLYQRSLETYFHLNNETHLKKISVDR